MADQTSDPMALTVPPSCCGARTRQGGRCGQISMANGRCRFQSGLSTGPRTAAGIARQRAAVTTHGMRGQEERRFRKTLREMREDARRICEVV